MRGCIKFFGLLLLVPLGIRAQVLPKEGCVLTCRLLQLNAPAGPGSSGFQFEIAAGNYLTTDSFEKNIVLNISSKTNSVVAEVPLFGANYTWRLVCKNKALETTKKEFHHFSIGASKSTDTSLNRLRIMQAARKYNDAYIFIDATKALYDMSGRIVWYMPFIDSAIDENTQIRDLKMTGRGTITFMAGAKTAEQIYEINYYGDILWKGPDNGKVSGDTSEQYHHEFTRLANGHYMVLGNENVVWAPPGMTGDPGSFHFRVPFGTLIEYDERGNVTWSWKSYNYFASNDLNASGVRLKRTFMDTHSNSFYFDEKNHAVYVSFKNINRIVKVGYPSGSVEKSYGLVTQPHIPVAGNLFCDQHSIGRTGNGYLYLYNNNFCDTSANPEVILMQETGQGSLKKTWEYSCTVEGNYSPGSNGGGNVQELPDQSLFVSMGGPYSKIFIVDHGKNILFSALPESLDPEDNNWKAANQYRASIIPTHADLEKMILYPSKK